MRRGTRRKARCRSVPVSYTHLDVYKRQELEYLRNYLLIQRHRYDNFEVYYDVDAQALPCLIPRLLIQPLVEKSLFHGLKNGSLHGCIYSSIPVSYTHLDVYKRQSLSR